MRLRTISRKMKQSVHDKPGTRGHAMVEVALMAPWIFLLFMGILDFGFYAYAAISVENPTRIAALYATLTVKGAITDSQGACDYVRQELQNMPNAASFSASCNAAPLVVTATSTTVGGAPANQVTVTYRTVNVFPLPWLPGVYNITRVVWMRQWT